MVEQSRLFKISAHWCDLSDLSDKARPSLSVHRSCSGHGLGVSLALHLSQDCLPKYGTAELWFQPGYSRYSPQGDIAFDTRDVTRRRGASAAPNHPMMQYSHWRRAGSPSTPVFGACSPSVIRNKICLSPCSSRCISSGDQVLGYRRAYKAVSQIHICWVFYTINRCKARDLPC